MPLINFKTDLKSLSWGRDKRDGGSSKQPYITKDIPEGLSSDNLPIRSGPDFIVRGGLKSVSNALDDVARIAQVVNPISISGIKFLAKQNLLSRTSVMTQAGFGLGYGGKIAPPGYSNQDTGIKIEGGSNVNQGVYTPVGTLLQALGNGLGVHTNLFGLDPTEPMSGVIQSGLGSLFGASLGLQTYESIVSPRSNPETLNRLEEFKRLIDEDGTGSGIKQNLFSYGGGPGAVLGIGKTNIRFADQRTGAANVNGNGILNGSYLTAKTYGPGGLGASDSFVGNDYSKFGSNYASKTYSFLNLNTLSPEDQTSLFEIGGADAIAIGLNGPFQNFPYQVNQILIDGDGNESYKTNNGVLYNAASADGFGFKSLTYNSDQLQNKLNIYQGTRGLYPQDFRKELYTYPNTGSAASEFADGTGGNQASTMLSLSPNYQSKNKDKRLNQGEPGRSNMTGSIKNVWDYGINAIELEALDKINAMPMYTSDGPRTDLAINDLIKFRIAAINNDGSNGNAVYMHFRAFLDSFSDSYTAEWNPVKYVGRGDSLYNYQGFGRSISLGFTTVAQSKAELIPMYKKLNYLASTLAPDYSEAGFMRGNLVRLTVGGYLYEQPGFISSLTYDVPQEASWEIALTAEGGSDASVKELPHMIKVSGFTFTPIHTFLPEKPNDANHPNTRFIALSNGVNNNYAGDYTEYLASGDGDNNSSNDILGA